MATVPRAEKIWFDGKLIPWDQATVHVTAHALHYGSSVFEGVRAYELPGGPAVFRLKEHVDRLFNSCKICRIAMPFSREKIGLAIRDTVAANGHKSCYIRPLVIRGAGPLGVDGRGSPTNVYILTWEWGKYLGADALEQGVEVGVSSWRRMAPDTCPAMAKIGGNYINSQFIRTEAAVHNYAEGIALDVYGYVSEGSGENVFLVREGELFTPPLATSILDGITRRSIITLAQEMGVRVHEEQIPRELLYVCDELFFSGTAAEITPIRAVDGIEVGSGKRGPLTAKLAEAFFAIVEGRVPDRFGWLTPVRP
jgi:branched-chain amino acid aminotransferase